MVEESVALNPCRPPTTAVFRKEIKRSGSDFRERPLDQCGWVAIRPVHSMDEVTLFSYPTEYACFSYYSSDSSSAHSLASMSALAIGLLFKRRKYSECGVTHGIYIRSGGVNCLRQVSALIQYKTRPDKTQAHYARECIIFEANTMVSIDATLVMFGFPLDQDGGIRVCIKHVIQSITLFYDSQ